MDLEQGDEHLVAAALRGDKDAFGDLLVRHLPLLIAVCRRALRDDGWAEDAAQEASLRAFLNLDRLRRPERFGSWLAGIGLNICRRWRQHRVLDIWSWEAMIGGGLVAEPIDINPGPADLVEAAELQAQVQRVVEGLPPGQRAAVTLHYLGGLTQAETASLLGIEPGAVKTRLYKARATLRRTIDGGDSDGIKRKGGRVMIEMRLVDVRRRLAEDGATRRHIVILDEVRGDRRLTIWIGEAEAVALALQLDGAEQPRPLTYAFAASLLQAANGRVREIRIDRLEGEVFYASAVIDGPAGEQSVDARPSDALNLALLLAAPIRVANEVLASTGGDRSAERFAEGSVETWVAGSEGWASIAAEVKDAWTASMGQQSVNPSEETT